MKKNQSEYGFPVRGNAQRGSVAVEFAIIAPLFFVLILAILEFGLLMTKIAMLDFAVAKASELIYVADNRGNLTAQALKDRICDRIILNVGCEGNLTVDVISVNSINGVLDNNVVCTSSSAQIRPVTNFDTGGVNEVTIIRACLTTPVVSPFLDQGLRLVRAPAGGFEIVSIGAFQNEP